MHEPRVEVDRQVQVAFPHRPHTHSDIHSLLRNLFGGTRAFAESQGGRDVNLPH